MSAKKARDSPLVRLSETVSVPLPNHQDGITRWALMVREVAKERQSFVPRKELEKLLRNDPWKEKHVTILQRMTAAMLDKGRRGRRAKDPNYFLISQKGKKELWGAFLTPNDKATAPAPKNITAGRHRGPFLFEIRESGRCQEKILVTIVEEKLEILGNRKELVSFLSLGGENDQKTKGETTRRRKPKPGKCPPSK